MKIYHGSEKIIKIPQYGFGSRKNDFGLGFYCTENMELAKEWACKDGNDGFVNEYEIEDEGLNILNLNSGEYNILNWLSLLTKYRGYWQKESIAEEAKDYLQEHFSVDVSGYDIVIGYRADDSYFSFAQDFIMGTISLRQLSQAMQLGKLGEQYVIKSKKAFEKLHFVKSYLAKSDVYYTKKVERDKTARRSYYDIKGSFDLRNEIFMIDIIRGGVRKDDLRI